MSSLSRRLAWAAICGWVWAVAWSNAQALEPKTVRVEGIVELQAEEDEASARRRAFDQALLAAALEVAADFVPAEMMELEHERILEALQPKAAGFVLTYRPEGNGHLRPSREKPEEQEFVLPLRATVDAAGVRDALKSLGLERSRREQPSILLRVRELEGEGGSLTRFQDFLTRQLEEGGMVVVEPSLAGEPDWQQQPVIDLARRLGTDLAVDVQVRWRARAEPTPLAGGAAEVRSRAYRSEDGAELAAALFEAPAYHDDPDEALARALEALQAQVADNLLLQLSRNWQALAPDDETIHVRLLNAPSLLSVNAVQHALRNTLGAEQADLVMLAPAIAELRVKGPLSPGALQDRLVAAAFDGFHLEAVEVSQRVVELRVEPSEFDPGSAPAPVGGRRRR